MLVDSKTELRRALAAEEAALSEAAARTADAANVGHVAVEAEQVRGQCWGRGGGTQRRRPH